MANAFLVVNAQGTVHGRRYENLVDLYALTVQYNFCGTFSALTERDFQMPMVHEKRYARLSEGTNSLSYY